MSRARGPLHWRRWRQHPLGVVALGVFVCYAIVALAVMLGWQADHWSNLSGGSWEPVSRAHWWGTNLPGQDIFARAIVSTKTSFMIGLNVMLGALLLGTALGTLAGMRHQHWPDHLVLWCSGVFDAIPFYLLAVAVGIAFDGRGGAVETALILSFWVSIARLIRGEIIRLQQQDFVAAARMSGLGAWRIALRHLIPNAVSVLLIQSVIIFVAAIKAEVLLSFIGLGVHDRISWGVMLAESTQGVTTGRFNNFFAASLMLSGLILALNQLADTLQDLLDPRYQRGHNDGRAA